MKKIFIFAAAAVSLSGCINEENVFDRPVAADISASIDGAGTRAFDTSWEDNDMIGITITDGSVSGGNVTGGGAKNLCYTHQGNGSFTVSDPSKKIIFENNNNVHFVAYYPYRSDRPANGTITGIKTSDQTDQKSFDFLWAERDGSKALSKVNFRFAHKMCKVTFVLKNDSEIDLQSISSFKLANVNLTTGSFNTNTGICSASKTSSSTDVTVKPAEIKVDGDEAVTSFILCPQTLRKIPVPFKIIDKDGYTYTCDLPFSSTQIEAGNNYQFIISLSKVGMQVTKSSIKGWEEMDQGDNWEAL